MLQQTQVKTVIPYWERWMHELPNIQSLAKAPPQKIHKLWEGLGYYTRVRNMQKAALLVMKEHRGAFPSRFQQVLELPGIGRYTAGAICSIAFNQPTPILDGNVIRVLTRLFGIAKNPREKKTNDKLWEIAGQLVKEASLLQPQISVSHDGDLNPNSPETPATIHSCACSNSCSLLNQSLMELGALLCTPKSPRCDLCPLAPHCTALQKNKVHQFPRSAPRPRATHRYFAAFIVERNGHFLVRQRPPHVVNAHLWEFPNIELETEQSALNGAAEKELGAKRLSLQPFCTIHHSITRYRICLQAFAVIAKTSSRLKGQWLKPSQLNLLPFPGAHKKILRQILAPNYRNTEAPNCRTMARLAGR